eukprot:GHRR01018065.1.p1 GENE.GHRR01018065.1~~GHRR01018065.1.p1  ORF type:complete len:201 (+),score=85.99 GHRR01018065.1:104-706(+)
MQWPATVLLLEQWQLQQQQGTLSNSLLPAAERHRDALKLMMKGWLAGQNNWTSVVSTSPGGLPWTANLPLPNVAAAGLLGLLWGSGADGGNSLTAAQRQKMQCFALQQATYILGANGSYSYLVGHGSKYPLRPQHRLASCSTASSGGGSSGSGNRTACDIVSGLLLQGPNPHILHGALVAGPAVDDSYADDRTACITMCH